MKRLSYEVLRLVDRGPSCVRPGRWRDFDLERYRIDWSICRLKRSFGWKRTSKCGWRKLMAGDNEEVGRNETSTFLAVDQGH